MHVECLAFSKRVAQWQSAVSPQPSTCHALSRRSIPASCDTGAQFFSTAPYVDALGSSDALPCPARADLSGERGAISSAWRLRTHGGTSCHNLPTNDIDLFQRPVMPRHEARLSDDFSMHLISDQCRTRRRLDIDTRHRKRRYGDDVPVRFALRRARSAVSGLAEVRQGLDGARRQQLRISRRALFNRCLRRRNVDDFPMRPAKSSGRCVRVMDVDDDALCSGRDVRPRNTRRNVGAVTSETAIDLFIRELSMVEVFDLYRKWFGGRDGRPDRQDGCRTEGCRQKCVEIHGALR